MTSALGVQRLRCAACGVEGEGIAAERAEVSCNVRAFRNEAFAVWRCGCCLSIHAGDEVNLGHYYRAYPFHARPHDRRLSILYDRQLRRLIRAGLDRRHRVLDYGAGGGGFVNHLKSRGYVHAFGYDPYSVEFSDPRLLESSYDFIVSQDVLEHALDPLALLDEFDRLLRPTGTLAIGTPNAEGIDLLRPERYVHTLHAPYHRHIFSKRALLAAAGARRWQLDRFYRTQYANTGVPFLNSRFYLYYMRLGDDSLDMLFEPPRLRKVLARLPVALFWGLLGAALAEETDVMAIFRRSHPSHALPPRVSPGVEGSGAAAAETSAR